MDKSMENLMTTSNSFEEAYILYSTMKQIKVKMDEKKRLPSLNVTHLIMTKKIKEFESITANYLKVTNIYFILLMI